MNSGRARRFPGYEPDTPTGLRCNALAAEPLGLPVPGGSFDRAAHRLERFAVFPPALATTLCERVPVGVGDVLGISYRLVPGLRLVFAARVSEVIVETTAATARRGFTYVTLAGHPFTGVETFAVEKDLASGEVRAILASWSRPQLPLIAALRHVARGLQVRGARAILAEIGAASERLTSPALAPRARRR